MKYAHLAAAVAAAALLGAGGAQAASFVGLFNTGTGADGLALGSKFGAADSHYSILSTTALAFTAGANAVTYEHPDYIDGDANSLWISGAADGQTGTGANTVTTYRLTFNLGDATPGSARISGSWGTDNEGEIFLNGVSTGIKLFGAVEGVLDLPGDYAPFQTLTNFTISSGFVAGANTLDFRVLDTGPPSALRVDNLVGSTAVPEPTTWALMLLGFAGAGAAVRASRRRLVVA